MLYMDVSYEVRPCFVRRSEHVRTFPPVEIYFDIAAMALCSCRNFQEKLMPSIRGVIDDHQVMFVDGMAIYHLPSNSDAPLDLIINRYYLCSTQRNVIPKIR